MKKLIRFVAGIVILLAVALVVMLVSWLGPLSQKAVEKWGPKVLGVEVKMTEVSIRPFSGTVRLEGLVVGNPKGYANPSLIEVGDFRANLQLSSLWSDTIVIEEMRIDRALVTYEKKDGTDNFKSLLANVESFSRSSGSAKNQKESSKKVIIEHLLVTNSQVRTKLGKLPSTTFGLPDIERWDIGGKSEGTDYGQAAAEVVGSLREGSMDAVKNGVKVVGDVLKGVGDTAGETTKEAGDKAKEATDKVLDGAGEAVKGLGDMFKK